VWRQVADALPWSPPDVLDLYCSVLETWEELLYETGGDIAKT
jgi:hypothetical protein